MFLDRLTLTIFFYFSALLMLFMLCMFFRSVSTLTRGDFCSYSSMECLVTMYPVDLYFELEGDFAGRCCLYASR